MLYQQKPIQVFRLHILMSSMVAFVVLCLREDACWSSGSKGLTESRYLLEVMIYFCKLHECHLKCHFSYFPVFKGIPEEPGRLCDGETSKGYDCKCILRGNPLPY